MAVKPLFLYICTFISYHLRATFKFPSSSDQRERGPYEANTNGGGRP